MPCSALALVRRPQSTHIQPSHHHPTTTTKASTPSTGCTHTHTHTVPHFLPARQIKALPQKCNSHMVNYSHSPQGDLWLTHVQPQPCKGPAPACSTTQLQYTQAAVQLSWGMHRCTAARGTGNILYGMGTQLVSQPPGARGCCNNTLTNSTGLNHTHAQRVLITHAHNSCANTHIHDTQICHTSCTPAHTTSRQHARTRAAAGQSHASHLLLHTMLLVHEGLCALCAGYRSHVTGTRACHLSTRTRVAVPTECCMAQATPVTRVIHGPGTSPMVAGASSLNTAPMQPHTSTVPESVKRTRYVMP